MNAKLAKDITKKIQESQDLRFISDALKDIEEAANKGHNRTAVSALKRQVKMFSQLRKLGFTVKKGNKGMFGTYYTISWENV